MQNHDCLSRPSPRNNGKGFSLVGHGQNGQKFVDDIVKYILMKGNLCALISIPLKFVPVVKVTISQQWLRRWLGTEQVTSHCLDPWWPSLSTQACITRPQNDQRYTETLGREGHTGAGLVDTQCIENCHTDTIQYLNTRAHFRKKTINKLNSPHEV